MAVPRAYAFDREAVASQVTAFVEGRLEVMLRDRFPGKKIEVINTATTAINSHVIKHIAREIARCSPDACIVYTGNNEVIGPYDT